MANSARVLFTFENFKNAKKFLECAKDFTLEEENAIKAMVERARSKYKEARSIAWDAQAWTLSKESAFAPHGEEFRKLDGCRWVNKEGEGIEGDEVRIDEDGDRTYDKFTLYFKLPA